MVYLSLGQSSPRTLYLSHLNLSLCFEKNNFFETRFFHFQKGSWSSETWTKQRQLQLIISSPSFAHFLIHTLSVLLPLSLSYSISLSILLLLPLSYSLYIFLTQSPSLLLPVSLTLYLSLLLLLPLSYPLSISLTPSPSLLLPLSFTLSLFLPPPSTHHSRPSVCARLSRKPCRHDDELSNLNSENILSRSHKHLLLSLPLSLSLTLFKSIPNHGARYHSHSRFLETYQTSETRWQDWFFNIWPLTTMQICPMS